MKSYPDCGSETTTIRPLNEDGSLDEIVGHGDYHLEQMSRDVWFLSLGSISLTIGIPSDRKRTVTAVPIDNMSWESARAATMPAKPGGGGA